MTGVKRKSKSLSKAEGSSVKETWAQKRRQREQFRNAFLIIISSLIFILAVGVPLSLLINPKIGIGLPLALVIFICSYKYPRTGLWMFLIYMPFSGTITYTIGGGNIAFQLAKDIFYLGALIGLIQKCRSKNKLIFIEPRLRVTLIVLLFFCAMTYLFVNIPSEFLPYCNSLGEENRFLRDATGAYILNPRTGIVIATPCKQGLTSLQGLLGLKVLLGYIPLIFCAYHLIETKKDLIFLGRLLLVLTIICCLLGLYQYRLLASGACDGTRFMEAVDIYKPQLEARCFVGGAVAFNPTYAVIRLPGTFVSPWHWGWFLIANAGITFVTTFSDPSWKWRIAGLGGMTLVFMNAVISGQRIALILVPVFFLVMLILTGQIFKLKAFLPIGLGLTILLFILANSNPEIFQQRVDSFVDRWNAAPPYLFIINQYNWALSQSRGILGNGLGLATSSGRFLGDIFLVETFHARVFYEIGLFGLLAFMAFVTSLVVYTFKSYRIIRDPVIKNYASSFWVFILLISYFPYWYPLDTDPVAVYYWFFVGVIFKAGFLQQQVNKETKAEKIKGRRFKLRSQKQGVV